MTERLRSSRSESVFEIIYVNMLFKTRIRERRALVLSYLVSK